MDFLEFLNTFAEKNGFLTPGKLKFTDQYVAYKNDKTGKVEKIYAKDFGDVNFMALTDSFCLRVFEKNGILHRFYGFAKTDKEKIKSFFKNVYKYEIRSKELSVNGWNWGHAKFRGENLKFDVDRRTAFEIPLKNVSQCSSSKNEVTMEFHQNEDSAVNLMEMRFYMPSNEGACDGREKAETFLKKVVENASIVNVSGDVIATFREIQCLTPRGRYDIKIFQSFLQLHGKTFDYKIPTNSVVRLFLLPHMGIKQMYFVISLNPPIRQGLTRYHFLVFIFGLDEQVTIKLPFSEAVLKEKYDGKLQKEMTGETYEILSKVAKCIMGKKIIGPSNFLGHTGAPVVSCSYKAAGGCLYPLERGLMYIYKPPMHIRLEEIQSVNFARGETTNRSFDLELELRSGVVHTFNNIDKEEYPNLYQYIIDKKITVKNEPQKSVTLEKFGGTITDESDISFDESDEETSESDSTDNDFSPSQEEAEEDIPEEYDSEDSRKYSEADNRKKSSKKAAKKKSTSDDPTKKTKKRKPTKDSNKPKKPQTSYMIWLNEHRADIKRDNPDAKNTEVAKIGGQLWRALEDKTEWEQKAIEAKREYLRKLKELSPELKTDSDSNGS